jgi:Endosomal/lysosomal potassium channel TMEM175
MREQRTTVARLSAFSDGAIAVIVAIMVLDLKAPDEPAFAAIAPLWTTVVSYGVSCLFIVVIWVDHHYLLLMPRLRIRDQRNPLANPGSLRRRLSFHVAFPTSRQRKAMLHP